MDHQMELLRIWLKSTEIAGFLNTSSWGWPLWESFHYIGLSLLLGTVGLFDLRLLGVGKRIPLAALHRIVPWGIFGFCINILTGLSFFSAQSDQYMYNPSFQLKMMFMALAGINVLMFYLNVFQKVKTLGPGEPAPLAARIAGGASLFFWLGVLTCGRLLTFYRPPFRWCPWC